MPGRGPTERLRHGMVPGRGGRGGVCAAASACVKSEKFSENKPWRSWWVWVGVGGERMAMRVGAGHTGGGRGPPT